MNSSPIHSRCNRDCGVTQHLSFFAFPFPPSQNTPMKPTLTTLALTLLLATLAFAQTSQPSVSIPASGEDDNAANALKNSTRHGEWVDVALPGSTTKINTWVVYPERKDKAPVVLVIHEIFGMTD